MRACRVSLISRLRSRSLTTSPTSACRASRNVMYPYEEAIMTIFFIIFFGTAMPPVGQNVCLSFRSSTACAASLLHAHKTWALALTAPHSPMHSMRSRRMPSLQL